MSNFKVGDIVRYINIAQDWDPGRGLVTTNNAEGVTVFWFKHPELRQTLEEFWLTKVEVEGG